MAVTLRQEVSEKLTGLGIACGFRFFDCQECADVSALGAGSHIGDEAPVIFPLADATNTAGVIALQPPIRAVFRLRADAEITASVIEAIAVDVVNDSSWICHAENKSMHENIALPALSAIASKFAACTADSGNGVERIGAFAEFAGLPLVLENKISIGIVNDGDLILGKLNVHDDCSFGNTLCSVAAPCKVQGFGDQPSRDIDIVGAPWQ